MLLHRTPYNKTETEATLGECRWFAARGYVVVNQDCRGCFRSEGEVNFLVPEAEDGADTIAWIRRQEWANGTVGSFGTSWSGWTQTAMAALGPAGLATMIPISTSNNTAGTAIALPTDAAINSMLMNMIKGLRRMRTPIAPMLKRMALKMTK